MSSCGLFYRPSGGAPVGLPLDGVHVAVRIVNLTAEVQVVQFYCNDQTTSINCNYEFPMDESAAVCGFEVELNDRVLIGEVREKQEARAEYHSAIARGQTAALLEENKPDVFSQLIGNIPPLSRVNVRVTYVTELKVDKETGGAIFVLPTSVAPRYSPLNFLPDAFPFNHPWRSYLGRRVVYPGDFAKWNNQIETLPFYPWRYSVPQFIVDRQRPSAFSITIEAEMASRILSVESRTHQLQVEDLSQSGVNNQAAASLWNATEPMGKDLEVIIYQEQPFAPSVQVEVAPDGSGCAMLTMVPEFETDPVPTEIVFVVDCSGSMSGERINAAKRALKVFLASLPLSCYFNIYRFGSTFTNLFPSSKEYNQQTLTEARNYADTTFATMGGTEILKPLQTIFSSRLASALHMRQVFILTDGQVDNTEAVLELCRKNASVSRVFSVGIGHDVSRHLVQGMARAASGTAEFIVGDDLKASSSALEVKLINQLKFATLPGITKIDVDWLGGQRAPSVAPAPSTQAPASKFFPTGPASNRPGQMRFSGTAASGAASVHAVGSGQWVVADASAAQPGGRNQSLYQAPFLPPPLFSGSKFLMFCFFAPHELADICEIHVTAKAPGGELALAVPITKVTSVGKTVHLLGARALVRDLSEGTSHLHYRKSYGNWNRTGFSWTSFNGWKQRLPIPDAQDKASAWELVPTSAPENAVKAEMVDVGTRFGIVSKETSFVAVERWRDGHRGDATAPPPLPMDAEPENMQSAFKFQVWEARNAASGRSANSLVHNLPSARVAYASAAPPSGASQRFCDSRSDEYESASARRAYGFAAPPPGASQRFCDSRSDESPPRATAANERYMDTRPDDDDEMDVADSPNQSARVSRRSKKKESRAQATTIAAPSVSDILSMQSFDGSVSATDSNAKTLGLNGVSDLDPVIAALSADFKLSQDGFSQIAMTLLLIQFLEMKHAASKGAWEVAVDKSVSWIVGTLAKGGSNKSAGEIRAEMRSLLALVATLVR